MILVGLSVKLGSSSDHDFIEWMSSDFVIKVATTSKRSSQDS